MKQRVSLLLAALLLAAVLIGLPVSTTSAAVPAHAGGVPQIFREPAGEFLISVWSLPDPLAVGEANFIVLITEEVDGAVDQYVLNADVNVRKYQGFAFGSEYQQATTTEATNNLFYELYTDFEGGGTWTIEVNVNDGAAVTTFDVEVDGDAVNQINWFQVGGIALAVIVIAWFVFQSVVSREESDA